MPVQKIVVERNVGDEIQNSDKQYTVLVDARTATLLIHLPLLSMSSTMRLPIQPVFPPKTRTRFISSVLNCLVGGSSDMVVDLLEIAVELS